MKGFAVFCYWFSIACAVVAFFGSVILFTVLVCR